MACQSEADSSALESFYWCLDTYLVNYCVCIMCLFSLAFVFVFAINITHQHFTVSLKH